jgi:formylglycine-generating enzyme required for sulfatase activity
MTFGPLSTTTYTVNGASFDMVRLPPGRFVDGKDQARRDLLVSRPLEIGLTLVTQTLWRAVTGSSPANFKGEDRPVEEVSYDDVQAFLARLPALGLTGFRLPTEAEWAWAARCGAPTRWSGADRMKSVAVAAGSRTKPVASLRSGPVGVFDQSGNLWEWVADWSQGLVALGAGLAGGIDPVGPPSGIYRINRGASWSDNPFHTSITSRITVGSESVDADLGFRLLRSAD